MSAMTQLDFQDSYSTRTLHPATLDIRQYVLDARSRGSRALGDSSDWKEEHHYLSDSARAAFLTCDKIETLLRKLASTSTVPIVPSQKAKEIHHEFQRIFCTLLYINKGHRIFEWISKGCANDAGGPFESQPARFPCKGDPDLWKEFSKAQWMFFVEKIKHRDEHTWAPNRILPFRRIEPLAEGDSAVVYKIQIDPEYNGLVEVNDHSHEDDTRDTFCLKTFHPGTSAEWQKERSALATMKADLKHDSSMIIFYGSYKQADSRNILLEYADHGTLQDYMQRTRPPITREEIQEFWQSMIRLISALGRLDHIGFYDDESYQGQHFDIKSENILVCSQAGASVFGYHFKLADFGCTVLQPNRSRGFETARASSGTKINAPPELRSRDPLAQNRNSADMDEPRVRSAIDTWSLGCVFSEVATWVVRGYDAIEEYHSKRVEANRRIYPETDTPGCFHDGANVLDVVHEWHADLLRNSRRSDHRTAGVLNLVYSHMLVPKAQRLGGNALLQAAGNILFQGTSTPIGSSLEYERVLAETSPGVQAFRKALFDSWPVPIENGSRLDTARDSKLSPGPFNVHDGEELNGVQTRSPETWPDDGDPALGKAPLEHGKLVQIPSHGSDVFSSFRGDGFSFPAVVSSPDSMYGKTSQDARRQNSAELASLAPSASAVTAATNEGSPTQSRDRPSFPISGRSEPMPERPGGLTHGPLDLPSESDLPRLALKDIETWEAIKASRKSFVLRGSNRTDSLPMEKMLSSLDGRDFFLLFDDSYSMVDHWHEVIRLAVALFHYLKRKDDDGVDVHFVHFQHTSKKKILKVKTATEMRKVLAERHPTCPPQDQRWKTDMYHALNQIIGSGGAGVYRRNLQSSKKAILFVFTDGKWQEDPESRIHAMIGNMAKQVQKLRLDPTHFGIQFIGFGYDVSARKMLQELDDNLHDEDGQPIKPDIVDTEMYRPDCNVAKILLGSINKWFDKGTRASNVQHRRPTH